MTDERYRGADDVIDVRWGAAWLLLAVVIVVFSAGKWAPGPPIWAPLLINTRDVARNVAIYIPFGAIGLATLRRSDLRGVARVVAAAGLFSLANEVLQLYTVNRVASVTDVLCAISGAAIGAGGLRLWLQR